MQPRVSREPMPGEDRPSRAFEILRVLEGKEAATSQEIANVMGVEVNIVSPVIAHLRRKGEVYDTGLKDLRSGHPRRVWAAGP